MQGLDPSVTISPFSGSKSGRPARQFAYAKDGAKLGAAKAEAIALRTFETTLAVVVVSVRIYERIRHARLAKL